jgi:hypothetical protein
MKENINTVDPEVYKLANIAIELKLKLLDKRNINKSKIIKDINDLERLIDFMLTRQVTELNSLDRVIDLGDYLYSVQIIPEKLHDKAIELSRQLSKSAINTTSCLDEIRSYEKVPKSVALMIVKTELDALLNFDRPTDIRTNSVRFNVFRMDNKKSLDVGVCTSVQYEIPFKARNNLNMDKYMILKSLGVDIYNPGGEAFSSRCFSSTDRTTGQDTTLNTRISNYYQGKQLSCSSGCAYAEITKNVSVKCLCPGDLKIPVFSTIQEIPVQLASDYNMDMLFCSYDIITSSGIGSNPGLYIGLIEIGLLIALILCLNSCYLKKYSANIDSLIYTDCSFYDREKHDIKKFFIRGKSAVESK